jgi:hypothetical protein
MGYQSSLALLHYLPQVSVGIVWWYVKTNIAIIQVLKTSLFAHLLFVYVEQPKCLNWSYTSSVVDKISSTMMTTHPLRVYFPRILVWYMSFSWAKGTFFPTKLRSQIASHLSVFLFLHCWTRESRMTKSHLIFLVNFNGHCGLIRSEHAQSIREE